MRTLSQTGRHLLLVALAATVLAGCSSINDYRTIAADPNRDAEKAKAKNDCAIRFAEKGRWDKAEKSWNEALIADVTFGPAHNNLGKLYFSQGKYYVAAWEFEYAHKLMPDQFEPLQNLGLVYETVGKFDEAVEMYGNAFALQPKNPEVIGNLARVQMRKRSTRIRSPTAVVGACVLDTRPEWTNWANEQLALMRSPSAAPPLETVPTPNAAPPLETIPTPEGVPTRSTPPAIESVPHRSTKISIKDLGVPVPATSAMGG